MFAPHRKILLAASRARGRRRWLRRRIDDRRLAWRDIRNFTRRSSSGTGRGKRRIRHRKRSRRLRRGGDREWARGPAAAASFPEFPPATMMDRSLERPLDVLCAVAGGDLIFRSGDHVGRVGNKEYGGGRNIVRLQPAYSQRHGRSANVPGLLCGVGWAGSGRPVSAMLSPRRLS